MPTYKVAHIREQGQDLVIIPLESAFGSKTPGQKAEALVLFELHTRAAGLAGRVALIWATGAGADFLGPKNWHQFLASIDYGYAISRINRTISW